MLRSIHHTPSEGDVRIVRNLLRTFLPLELVDVIIADAEYWLCIHVERSKQIRVDARIALGQGFKLAWCYLVSPPIPETLSSVGQGLRQRRVRKVQLKVQGPRDAGSIKGREGFGHELVRALQPGDRIAILALAQQWGWENHVYSASITIQYSV
ncbi:MAG: hypothetical protein NXY57DRAFT_552606 [Lentinula lateritia]|nr:MAG: hypothetical protein NXY57DRAFT_552606 [Lentinula lateritia]